MSDNHKALWQDAKGEQDVRAMFTEIRDSQEAMMRRVLGIERQLQEHVAKDDALIKMAFVGADPDGHRRAHQAMIDMIEAKRKLGTAIQEKTISGIAWALIVGLALIFWNWLATHFGFKP